MLALKKLVTLRSEAPADEPEAPAEDATPDARPSRSQRTPSRLPADEGEPESRASAMADCAIGECESNPGFMLVQCKTACELKKLEEPADSEAPPGDGHGGHGGDGYDWDDNGMFGYGAQGDDGYEYGAQNDDGYEYGAQDDDGADGGDRRRSNFYDDAAAEAEEPAAQPAAAEPEPTEAEEPAEQPAARADARDHTPQDSKPAVIAEAVAIDVTEDINYEAKWAPMEVVIALFIFVACAFSMTRLCRAKEDQYAPVTRAISERTSSRPTSRRGPRWRTSGGCWTTRRGGGVVCAMSLLVAALPTSPQEPHERGPIRSVQGHAPLALARSAE